MGAEAMGEGTSVWLSSFSVAFRGQYQVCHVGVLGGWVLGGAADPDMESWVSSGSSPLNAWELWCRVSPAGDAQDSLFEYIWGGKRASPGSQTGFLGVLVRPGAWSPTGFGLACPSEE